MHSYTNLVNKLQEPFKKLNNILKEAQAHMDELNALPDRTEEGEIELENMEYLVEDLSLALEELSRRHDKLKR